MNMDVNGDVAIIIRRILELTRENAEEAQQIAQALASLDWQQAILTRRQRDIESRLSVMQDFLAWRERGGEFCDECKDGFLHRPIHNKVYSWPHEFDPDSPDGVNMTEGKRYCQQCFYRKQEKARNMVFLEYRRMYPDIPTGFAPMWKREMTLCCECRRMFPEHASFRFSIPSQEGNIYSCLHCVERVAERQFVQCQECNKKTANTIKGFCYDCYSISFSLGSQLSVHLDRARKANTPATLTLRQWAATVAYFGKKCAYCQSRPFQVLEHFHPISLGGGTTVENCVPACHTCNSKKSAIHPERLHEVFPCYMLDRVKDYLQNGKQENSPYALSGRELIVLGG